MTKKSITLFDGPHGMPLWDKAQMHGYEKLPVWMYNIEHPQLVEELDRQYLDAGSKIILSNTFAANHYSVLNTPYSVKDIIKTGVTLAKTAVAGTDAIPGVAVGPLPELLEPFGELEESDCQSYYEEIFKTAAESGAELAYIQTFMDLNMMKIAVETASYFNLPMFCSMTFQRSGKTLFGNSVSDLVHAMEPYPISAIGINCELGPKQMLPIVKSLSEQTSLPIVVKPNASIMSTAEETGYLIDPVTYARECRPLLDYVTYIGGCCGCDHRHIQELKKCIDSAL